MQHHFIVFFDDVQKIWSIDYEGIDRFSEGEIWDEKSEQWICSGGDDTPDEVTAISDQAAGDLAAILAIGTFVRNQEQQR
jgi:hypothetical protein